MIMMPSLAVACLDAQIPIEAVQMARASRLCWTRAQLALSSVDADVTAECPRDELRLSFDGLQALAAGRFRYIHEGASASPGSGHRSGASDEPLHQFVSLLLESARMGGARG